MFNMTPTRHAESPLRRSGAATIRSPMVTPINDDEEERRASRAKVLDASATSSIISHNEGLQNCLKIFNENKISKENAWTMSLIDHFSVLIARHHNSLNNFQVVGSTLEASSKIYGFRVDSVHMDVMRMSTGLTRNKPIVRENENDQNDDENASTNNNAEDDGQPKQKKKRMRKAVSTITKNKESINAKLDTHPFTDPIFAKLNSTVGNINSANRLLQNVLHTVDSELILRMDYKFWDSTELQPNNYLESYDYTCATLIDVPMKLMLSNNDLLRPQHTGYKISDIPAEEDTKDETSSEKFDQSQIDVAFDMDADIEPVTNNHDFIDVDLGDGVFDGLTMDDQTAINACKGLRRAPVMVEDLRPLDSSSSNLEYSYRPLDNICQFWAGPSHWKFKKLRAKSMGIRSLHMQHHDRTERKNTLKSKIEPVSFDGEFDNSTFISVNSKAAFKLKKTNIYKKWDPKKLKLPTDLQLNRNRFNIYTLAPGVQLIELAHISTPEIETSGYNYDNATDREYCSNLVTEIDDDTDRSTGGPENNDNPVDHTDANATVAEINTEFIGAPEMIAKIDVPFAKRAKVVDMKQLKRCCLGLITKQCQETQSNELTPKDSVLGDFYKNGFASFSKIYEKLPLVLSRNMQEALSPAVAFYSILHLANDCKLRLIKTNDKDLFHIRQICDDDDDD